MARLEKYSLLDKNTVLKYYDHNDSRINFRPKELGSGNTELFKSVPLYNLIQVLDFSETEHINISYIKTYINLLFSEPLNFSDKHIKMHRNRVIHWVKSTFCKIYLRFLDHRVTVSEQKRKFEFVDLLASIGGSIGL